MRVVLSRHGDRAVTKQLGDGHDVSSCAAQLVGERVAEAVGVNSLLDARLCGQALEQQTHVLRVDSPAVG